MLFLIINDQLFISNYFLKTHKLIQMNSVKNEDWSKPNSPVYLTVPSPTPEVIC